MDKRGLIQFYQNLVTPQNGEGKRREKRQLDLFPFFPFSGISVIFMCRHTIATRSNYCKFTFNCKIFLQFHPVSEISEMRNERI